MTKNAKIALNPLPCVLTERGFELSVPVLRLTFSEIASNPLKAIQADPPAGLTPLEKYTMNPTWQRSSGAL
jgi:hypothetical protein